MKHFLVILIGLLSSNIFAWTNVVGTWEWSGAGCRDASLSASSHITKGFSTIPSAFVDHLTFDADGSVVVHILGQVFDEFPYTVTGSEVAVSITGTVTSSNGEVSSIPVETKFNVVNDDLVHDVYQLTPGYSSPQCSSGMVYVFVYNKID